MLRLGLALEMAFMKVHLERRIPDIHGPLTQYQRSRLFGMSSNGHPLYANDILRLQPLTAVSPYDYVIVDQAATNAFLPMNSAFDYLGAIPPDMVDPRFVQIVAKDNYAKMNELTVIAPPPEKMPKPGEPGYGYGSCRGEGYALASHFNRQIDKRSIFSRKVGPDYSSGSKPPNMCTDPRQNLDRRGNSGGAAGSSSGSDSSSSGKAGQPPKKTPVGQVDIPVFRPYLSCSTDPRMWLANETTHDPNLVKYFTNWPQLEAFSEKLCDILSRGVVINGVLQMLDPKNADAQSQMYLHGSFWFHILKAQYEFPANIIELSESNTAARATLVFRVLLMTDEITRNHPVDEALINLVCTEINDIVDSIAPMKNEDVTVQDNPLLAPRGSTQTRPQTVLLAQQMRAQEQLIEELRARLTAAGAQPRDPLGEQLPPGPQPIPE